jgi:hypothetical protein
LEDTQSTEAYIPGVCNIGPAERNKRLRIGYIGLALMIIFIISAEVYDIPQIWKLALFAPAVYSLSGFIQARNRFCFLYGFLGLFSFTGKRSKVRDEYQLHKDRSRALYLIGQIVIGSALITLMYYFIS